MRRKKPFSNAVFISTVNEYLSGAALILETDDEGKAVGENQEQIEPDTFYVFNGEALTALSEAIEDTALEEANGTLLAAVQDFDNLADQKERYQQLAATLDDVRVFGAGKNRTKMKGVRYSHSPKFKNCWCVVYNGKNAKVMLLAEECEGSREREFCGFYTFNPKLISTAAKEIEEAGAGNCPVLGEFRKLQSIDRAAKQLQANFAREQTALNSAIEKFRSRNSYDADKFLQEVDRSMDRLQKCVAELPALLVS